jgi:hypothetical protein
MSSTQAIPPQVTLPAFSDYFYHCRVPQKLSYQRKLNSPIIVSFDAGSAIHVSLKISSGKTLSTLRVYDRKQTWPPAQNPDQEFGSSIRD